MFDSWKTDSQGAAGLSRGRYLLAVCGTLALAALAALTAIAVLAPTARAQTGDPGDPSGSGVEPDFIAGNPDCADLGYAFELKFDPPNNGTKTAYDDETVTVKNSDGTYFDWESTFGIDAVIVKGGPNADAFVYDPPEESQGDTDLHSPINPNTGEPFGLSHISFCYDIELEVEKNAQTTFTRDYDWEIEKSNDAPNPVELAPGQTYDVNYDVTVDLAGFTDSDWAVTGEITVHNPAPVAANGVTVEDVISNGDPDITADVDCSGDPNDGDDGLPATIAAGGTLECTYSATLPDGTSRTNTATADSTTNGIEKGSGTAPVTFGDPTTEEDRCVDVSDDKVDLDPPAALGTVCAADAPKTFEYTKTFGPFPNECVTHTFTNTASFVTNTNGDTGSDTSTVTIEVQCTENGGCSLTPGYWKTHSDRGPAPYDDNWANLGSLEEDTLFFLSGKTYYTVLWTSPSGNAYYVLAHAYIAAVLNGLNGADVSDIQDELDAAEVLFSTKTPTDVAALKGKTGNERRAQIIALAETLDDYNNGIIGPGHCDEDDNSAA